MSENYIVINGKRAELTEEQLKALGVEIKSPFDRASRGDLYYAISITGEVELITEKGIVWDKERHDVANYCTDEKMIEQRALQETLNRLLWRYSMEHKGNDETDWNNTQKKQYFIYYDKANSTWFVDYTYATLIIGSVGFCSSETAESAIKEIIEPFMAEHPDFKL